jgi:hypothetical protein
MTKARNLADLGNVYDDGALSNRNLIINGAMQVAQRGTSEAGVTTTGYYCVDHVILSTNIATTTVTQEADGPSGFANSLKIEVTTAEASPATGDFMAFEHRFEGQDLQRIKKGTADAQPVTLSFWVKSNKTGTYIVEFDDNDNARNINKSYTVDVSGTWEYKTITFEADTTGAFDNDNAMSGRLFWWLDSGSDFEGGTLATSWESTTNANRNVGGNTLGDTIGNYFQITGVQLEVGDTATPFEHRSYGQELALCQRYYSVIDGGSNAPLAQMNAENSTDCYGVLKWPVRMRTTPTLVTSGTAGDYRLNWSSNYTLTSVPTLASPSSTTGIISAVGSGLPTDGALQLRAVNGNGFLGFDAEL